MQVMNRRSSSVCPNLCADVTLQTHCTFDVVHNRDYVLSEQLRRAATELCGLNVLENGAKFWILLSGIQQLPGQVAIFREGGAKSKREGRSKD